MAWVWRGLARQRRADVRRAGGELRFSRAWWGAELETSHREGRGRGGGRGCVIVILAANTTRWRASLELSPDGVVHPVANASTVTCSDHDVAANGSHSLELSVDEVRRDAIRAEFAWSWHAVRHVGD